MTAGCLVSFVLWLIFASLLTGSLVPIAFGVVMGGGLIVLRGLGSERPLY